MNVRGKGFSKTMDVKAVLDLLLKKALFFPIIEKIQTSLSLDRILSDDIYSNVNLPGFDRSAMDGYAVIATDTYGASENNPIQLKIIGSIEIGESVTPTLQVGSAIRISTGASLPLGANAVVMIEDCEEIGSETLEIVNSVAIGKNVAKMDEDVKKGELLFRRGHLIKPWDIALLESICKAVINVQSRPRVATLSTGNELIQSGSIPQLGQIIDCNRPAINSWLVKLGVSIVKSDFCQDKPEVIQEKITELTGECDLIITTGGTSVGTKDYIPEIIEKLGELWVHGVSIRPGKPLALGKIIVKSNSDRSETPIISLPGYPLAAFINFDLFISPLLSRWTNLSPPWQNFTKVKLLQNIPSKIGFRDFIRLKKVEDGAVLIRITGAGILSSLVQADYMLEIPEHIEGYTAGEWVEVKNLRGDTNV